MVQSLIAQMVELPDHMLSLLKGRIVDGRGVNGQCVLLLCVVESGDGFW